MLLVNSVMVPNLFCFVLFFGLFGFVENDCAICSPSSFLNL